ncbi:SurA N-terminal domain-containing protein, partial [Rhodobacteraceae bacterium]|nr:SurA N-terminal domain-containing protein [Paracoccaceae bacterium]
MASSKGKNIVTFAILGLLILALAGFGVTEFGGSVRSVATVGKAEIETHDYARAVQAQMQRLQQQIGQPLTFQQARAFGVDQAALGQLITAAALENEAAEIGLSVGDTTVGERIQNAGGFRNASGEFDRAIYEATLRQNGSNAGEYEDDIRSDMAEGLLQSAIAAGVRTPDIYTNTLYNFARETRDVTWARLGPEELEAPIPAPTDIDLTTYHEANPELFTRPETKRIRYALLSPDMLIDQIEVDETVLRAAYDARITEFVQPERRLVERLVFLSDDQATAAKARLDAGELTFDELVTERGLDLSAIDLGDVDEPALGAAGADIYALSEPGVVGPLPSDLGPALYRMNGIL